MHTVYMNNHKKIYFWVLVTLIVCFLIGYIAHDATNPQTVQPPIQHTQLSIPIGFIAPLSGPFASWGKSIQNGLELGLADSVHNFKVTIQDSVCDPKQTVSIAQQLITIEHIKFIVGPGCVTGLKAITPIADEHETILFSTGLLDEEATITYSNIINWASDISSEARYMAAYLDQQDITRVSIIHGTNAFGQEYAIQLSRALTDRGILVTSTHPMSLDDQSFYDVLSKIKKEQPDAVFIHQGENQIGIFARQLAEQNLSVPIFSYYGAESNSTRTAGADALEGMRYTYPINHADTSPAYIQFQERYHELFGEDQDPTATSYFVYDGIRLLDEAFTNCGLYDTACVLDFFHNYGIYRGISGDMTFNSDGSLSRPFGIKEFKNGQFKWLEKNIDL